MSEAEELARMLEVLLAPAPDRVIEATVASDPVARAQIDGARELLGSLGLALVPVAPSPALRQRFASAIAAAPRVAPRRAVLVVDMQNDHLTAGRPVEVPRALGIVPAVRARIEQARASGEPVLYLCDRHQPGDPELAGWGTHNVAGSEGAAVWAELAPRETDRVFFHRGYNGFHDNALGETLRELSIDTLVFTGCVAEMQIYVTATEALSRGLKVEVPPGCIAGGSPVGEAVVMASLSVMSPVLPFTSSAR